ncbi:MAG: sigma-70 family RNA polymerase sigma factor [Candidatus Latescibacteria bacterium]|nr:sigma-70 family RNA polymerase sigma factor [Candidatus Latescibacterota bacterium]
MARFRQLCREHRDRIYTFACYYMGNREDAEDITQEVLLRLWRHRAPSDAEGAAAWLTRVARNACLDALRRRHSYRAVVSGQDPEPVLQNTRAGDEKIELRLRLEAALTRLDSPYREIIILREIQGLPYSDISRSLELPLNTVKVYLHRGRRRLRALLQE